MTPITAFLVAIVAIGLFGLLFGVLLALLGVMAWSLHRTASEIDRKYNINAKAAYDAITVVGNRLEKFRIEIAAALTKLDADRLADASLAIQSSAKSLDHQTTTLAKLLYAQSASNPPAQPLAGFATPDYAAAAPGAFSMEEETEDDQRMVQERDRWKQANFLRDSVLYENTADMPQPRQPLSKFAPPSPLNYSDPLAGHTTAQREKAVADFFARRRRGDTTQPAADTLVEALTDAMATAPIVESAASLPDLDDGYAADTASCQDNTSEPEVIGGVPSRGDLDE